jgi:hypothetical protein
MSNSEMIFNASFFPTAFGPNIIFHKTFKIIYPENSRQLNNIAS